MKHKNNNRKMSDIILKHYESDCQQRFVITANKNEQHLLLLVCTLYNTVSVWTENTFEKQQVQGSQVHVDDHNQQSDLTGTVT